jgi:succinyl-CoA synthetase alpha subunit
LEEEAALKKLALKKGLLVLGPGCGAAVLGGVSVGMMSSIGSGPIGIVGASGSGIHEIAALIDRGGSGITQAIGTGGRDLSEDVGGITMSQGIKWLQNDQATRVMVLVSKPPHPEVAEKIFAQVMAGKKPAVVFFLGGDNMKIPAGIHRAFTLEEAATMAMALAEGEPPATEIFLNKFKEAFAVKAKSEKDKLGSRQKWLRGLFCGGTHNEEAILVLKDLLPEIHSNVDFGGAVRLPDARTGLRHSLVDMGDEEFTLGKPHPVMEPSILNDRLLREALNPEVAVVLFDLLLGYGANADPVGAVRPALEKIRQKLAEEKRNVALVATVTGTNRDPQNFREQCARLAALGVTVKPSNSQAALYAGMIVA